MTLAFIVFFILLFTGLPLYVNLGLTSFLFIFLHGFKAITAIQRIAMAANSFTLIAAPFFIIMGNLMNSSGVTKRMFNFANVLVGHLPGGLGHANVVASVLFAGMSGTAVADAGGLGNVEIQAMRDKGFDDDFSCAITAASSVIGPIIPPSLPMVIIAVAAEASVGRLFIGGILPGLTMAVSLMLMVAYYAKKRNYPRNPKPTLSEVGVAFREAFLALMSPVILVAGIFSGIFTPTEAAVVAAAYSLILGVFVYHEIKLKDLPKVILSTIETNGVVLALVMTASLFGWVLTVSQVPQKMSEFLVSFTSSRMLVLLIVNIFLLVVGMFMEATAAILILTPILIPVMASYGVDVTQGCLIMILNLMIGVVTPPVGVVLYIISNIAKVKFERVVKATLPFFIPLGVTLALVTFVPFFTTFLPNLFYGAA
ncbi:MAG: TRAP transporter large permease [Sphaerochaetaceae bacterium]|nr:TRAP transporter large permease [Spirochaetales bacterium]MDY5499297.1 TRAP transporter large permease [Sphaerochaetaceae bacterium]